MKKLIALILASAAIQAGAQSVYFESSDSRGRIVIQQGWVQPARPVYVQPQPYVVAPSPYYAPHPPRVYERQYVRPMPSPYGCSTYWDTYYQRWVECQR
ncbi:hypothetical protein FDI24_gp008 [Acidovorax phage ACP17]|uniref:Uncharacterized protein n=1 Tax=Acidovorax phage ACP17 TaxID=2010329 RepID=A0A218M3B6_9CAUD|nr:hypothetical protein FDI24_gp008 [Acidovorax phage ACP17]ASD50542.1 hypothetical protein [Acidovorax phage ACP17]